MELYGKIVLIAMPIFFGLVLLEKAYGWWIGKDTFRTMDMISSMSSGITNVVKDVLGLSVSIITYAYMVEHIAVFKIENTVLCVIIAFIVLDFQGYWVHRCAHQINIFWNKHAIHHSSEDFNFACALRQSISSFVNLFTFFLLPAALFGVPTNVIAIITPIHLFAQFWYHTQHIKTMGFLEKIIVTPSHHRVHHAMNIEYLDKNFGQIFIIWDKLFHTFQVELPSSPPVYGITRPVKTWNPIKINFQHMIVLIKDAWHTENIYDKFRIWFMPTGWRPADVESHFPIGKIDDVYNFEKYDPANSLALKAWAWVQISCTLLLTLYLLSNLAAMELPYIFIYGAFIFLSIYSYTELMDRNPNALFWEAFKNIIGLVLIYQLGDWFGMKNLFPFGKYIVSSYFIAATIITTWFVMTDIKPKTALILR